ncbi:MAG TPA: UDP-3-O-(3-hydroxymyristoyl)glucosamine N-acyltransferase [Terriglobales bacterium]|nr:UDP-3-O-(3-hydroxymyristoyl)glucosamine N-acyltransferase [Terriglobales bacterium]
MAYTLQALAEFTAARLIGDGDIEITKVASIAQAQPGELIFVQDEKDLARALTSRASAVIAGEFASSFAGRKPLLISDNPRLAFARAGALLHPPKTYPPGVHPTAIIRPSAQVAATAAVDAHAVIEAGAVIGERAHIGANCSIGEGVVIGEDCDLYPCVVIYKGTTLGRRVIVHAGAVLGSDGFGFVRDETYGRYQKFPQIGTLEIGDYVEIGANCTVDRGALDKTVIGPGTKLDNLVHIGHNDVVGANVVIAAQTGVSGSSEIGDGCVIGGQVGIADHVKIEGGTILGAQTGVPSNKILRGKGVVFWGTPARPIGQYLKELAVLARLARGKRRERP